MFLKVVLAVAVAAAVTGAASAATVVFSDNFDANAGGLNTTPSGWALDGGSVDIIPIGSDFVWYGSGQYIDMNGSTGFAGSISTSFATVAGYSYNLSFGLGYNNGSGTNEMLSYSVGNLAGVVDLSTQILQVGVLQTLSFDFVALSNLSILKFADVGSTPGDNGGPILDNVVATVVPLPAAASLLLAALGGLAMLRRRRRV